LAADVSQELEQTVAAGFGRSVRATGPSITVNMHYLTEQNQLCSTSFRWISPVVNRVRISAKIGSSFLGRGS
jgi:hypothetical protein